MFQPPVPVFDVYNPLGAAAAGSGTGIVPPLPVPTPAPVEFTDWDAADMAEVPVSGPPPIIPEAAYVPDVVVSPEFGHEGGSATEAWTAPQDFNSEYVSPPMYSAPSQAPASPTLLAPIDPTTRPGWAELQAKDPVAASLQQLDYNIKATTYANTLERLDSKASKAEEKNTALGNAEKVRQASLAYLNTPEFQSAKETAAKYGGPAQQKLLEAERQLKETATTYANTTETQGAGNAEGYARLQADKALSGASAYENNKQTMDLAHGRLTRELEALDATAKAKLGGAVEQYTALYNKSMNSQLSLDERASAANAAAASAIGISDRIQTLTAMRNPQGLSMHLYDGFGRKTGDLNYAALPVYLTMFGAIFAPLMQYQQAKAARDFQMDMYKMKREDDREDLRYSYEMKAEFGYDPASVAAAEHSAKGSAPKSTAPSLSSAKVKVS